MQPKELRHITIFKDENYFCAWPFNGGLYHFSDGEIVAGFMRAKVDYSKPETLNHRAVDQENGEHVFIRSYDDGETWSSDTMTTLYKRPDWDKITDKCKVSTSSDISYNPHGDGYMLMCGYGFPSKDVPGRAYVIISENRGKSWCDPIGLPAWMSEARFEFVCGRPSYVVRKDGMLLLFGAGSRASEQGEYGNGSRPLVWASWNGGASWGFLSEVELSPASPMGIMPYPLIMQNNEMLMAVRRQYNGYNAYMQIYHSHDEGRTWQYLSRVNDWGAPANLVQLSDGRIVCIYGYRQQKWGIRARVSENNGKTWGEEIIIRDDGGSWDLGYPRSFVKKDGSIFTIYYFNSIDDSIQQSGGVRHIAASIWRI